jgi:hypothetical protein
MLNLNGTNWYINSLGKNEIFYYGTITNDIDIIEFQYETSEKKILIDIYEWLLTQPEFAGSTLINS